MRAKKRKKLTLKNVAKKVSKLIYKYVIEEPEKERERDIAEIERLVAKRLKWRKRKKGRRSG